MSTRGADPALAAPYIADGAPSDAPANPEGDMHDEELDEDDDQEEVYESSSSPSTETDTLTWINWFCSLPGHEYFCDVAEDFIEDDFNLTGLAGLVPFYKEAMEMVLDVEPEEDEAHRVPDVSIVESSTELLYGLIHQRYIITRQGLQQMFAKYDAGHFGTCPRVYCTQSKLVPCGRSDLPGVDTVKLFCPSCLDMYVPPSSRFQGVDGAFFGTTFPHLLFQTFPPTSTLPSPQLDPQDPKKREHTTPLTSLSKVYVPRIYGFKVSERARSGPRMQWMRMRPRTEGELVWTDNAIRPDPSGPSGSGERGDLFEEDALDEEDDEEEEEEEEDATGQAGAPAAGGVQEQDDRAVHEVASALQATSVWPRRTDREIKPLPRSPTAGFSASPSPSSASIVPPPPAAAAAAAPASAFTASLPSPQTLAQSPAAASAALAASIRRHLAAASAAGPDLQLPRPPNRAYVLEKEARGGQRAVTAVGTAR
ncbi:hypothetical protein JCM21900_002201 [Sporobolomyces salmonicolor]